MSEGLNFFMEVPDGASPHGPVLDASERDKRVVPHPELECPDADKENEE